MKISRTPADRADGAAHHRQNSTHISSALIEFHLYGGDGRSHSNVISLTGKGGFPEMPWSTSPSGETASIDYLTNQVREIVSRPAFDKNRWKSLKMRIAATPATDLAGVIEKLRIVHTEVGADFDELDLRILESAINDIELLSETI